VALLPVAPLEALDPLLPAARGHPEAVDQDDGVSGAGGLGMFSSAATGSSSDVDTDLECALCGSWRILPLAKFPNDSEPNFREWGLAEV
jgi:hypothetical protein